MPEDEALQDLLDRWEAARAEGRSLTAEELCRDHPALLEEVRGRIRAMQAMDDLLGASKNSCPPSDWPSTTDSPEAVAKTGYLAPGVEPVPGYRLLSRLGQGGFGEVWKAAGPGGFPVALKFVRLAGKAGAVETHALEVIKGVRHANLLPTFGAWQRDSFLIVAMELADRTLLDRFQEAKARNLPGIPGPELLEYFTEAARGIDFLNTSQPPSESQEAAGIQHRDIKPQNLLLVGGCVKVADFGLARVLSHTVTGHSGSMTPAYAAPEYFEGRTHRHSDQYSLAVAYCQLRGGRLPFEGNAAEVMAGHLHRPPDLTMLPEVERPVVARALAKNPAQRWPTCRTFVEELGKVMPREVAVATVVEGQQTVRENRPTSMARWSRVYVALGASILLAVGAFLTWKHLHRNDELPGEAPGDRAAGLRVKAPVDQPAESEEPDEWPADDLPLPAFGSKKAEAACKQGLKLFAARNNDKAIKAFTEAIQHDPNCALAYAYRGWVHAREHRGNDAIRDANRALRRVSKDDLNLTGIAYYVRGHGHRYKAQHDEAIADYTMALRFRPDWSSAYYWRGLVYRQKGDLKRAKADQQKVRKLKLQPRKQ
jgi:hypothetical protein